MFAPNSFTPNGDNCNDKFYLSGLGEFLDFKLEIYNRWGGDIIFESNEIIYVENFSENNLCNDNLNQQSYYKMGEWDGLLKNGEEAIQGSYVYIVSYKLLNNDRHQYMKGNITLIR